MKTPLRILFAILFAGFTSSGLQAQNVGVGTFSPQSRLHVAGSFRADTLLGSGNRVVRSNPTGEIDGIPSGNLGEILTQTPTGPQWQGLTFSTNSPPGGGVNGCDSCATVWSTTSPTTMSWGQCNRNCEQLVEGGYDDWRMPTFDETLRLLGKTATANDFIWTLTPVTAEFNSTSTGRYVMVNLVHGQWYNGTTASTTGLCNCKCVR